ncbi:type IV secretory system conjugative DNA transfer family protein [Maioricimonas sp. JC845]|uniref:type IV secretory system conjugative DNA transfer family protein n=1 Tax=Maioricimonas sp. JC845 TaxID=3232138 RepID=UPI003458653D
MDDRRIANGRTELILGELGPQQSFGFGPQASESPPGLITYSGDAHLCTVAPTRSGKGVGIIVPNLLTYTGPVIVIDPKGENYVVTARRREELGHRVIKLDPFGVIDDETDSLNPLDLCQLPGSEIATESQAIAEMLSSGLRGTREPFWDLNGTAFAAGLIALAATQGDDAHCNLSYVLDRLTADDIGIDLEKILEAPGNKISPLAYREIASVLQMPDLTRGGVIATTKSYFASLNSAPVRRAMDTSTFSLQDVTDGKPLSIYLIVPANRMQSHRVVLKLWVGTLLAALFSRQRPVPMKTLFMLDEVAQLGQFPLLESMSTLSAGYAVWLHTLWQDLSQLKSCYPSTWKNILNNCAVIQTFGIYNYDMARQWGQFLQTPPDVLNRLEIDEQLLSLHGQGEQVCRRLNYLTDPRFEGQWDPNRFFEPEEGDAPER